MAETGLKAGFGAGSGTGGDGVTISSHLSTMVGLNAMGDLRCGESERMSTTAENLLFSYSIRLAD